MVFVGKGKHNFVIVQHFCPILTQYPHISLVVRAVNWFIRSFFCTFTPKMCNRRRLIFQAYETIQRLLIIATQYLWDGCACRPLLRV